MFCFDHQKHIKQTKWLQTIYSNFKFFSLNKFCHFSNTQQNATLCFSIVNLTNLTFFFFVAKIHQILDMKKID
jgi:hypothetical protein